MKIEEIITIGFPRIHLIKFLYNALALGAVRDSEGGGGRSFYFISFTFPCFQTHSPPPFPHYPQHFPLVKFHYIKEENAGIIVNLKGSVGRR